MELHHRSCLDAEFQLWRSIAAQSPDSAWADLGHELRASPSVIGSVQAVRVNADDGLVEAGADSRRAGTVVGLPRP